MPNLGTTAPSKVMLQQNPEGAQSVWNPRVLLRAGMDGSWIVMDGDLQFEGLNWDLQVLAADTTVGWFYEYI